MKSSAGAHYKMLLLCHLQKVLGAWRIFTEHSASKVFAARVARSGYIDKGSNKVFAAVVSGEPLHSYEPCCHFFEWSLEDYLQCG